MDFDVRPPDPADGGPVMTACRSNAECPARAYCEATGCDTPGVCRPRPDTCATIFDPVCGCDRRSYSNPCSAAGNGVRVASRGECGVVPPPTDAGVSRCTAILCGPGTTCCESSGRCCPDAARDCCRPTTADAGVPDTGVPDVGRIDSGTPPGCRSNAECGARQFCGGAGCDTPGRCMDRPSVCTTLFNPVCGCDRVTYSNECTAHGAGARVASRGACGERPDAGVVDSGSPVACRSNDGCTARTEYCNAPGCDTPGTCHARPTTCSDERSPVCGCNRMTYRNACMAAVAGVRIAHRTACP